MCLYPCGKSYNISRTHLVCCQSVHVPTHTGYAPPNTGTIFAATYLQNVSHFSNPSTYHTCYACDNSGVFKF